MGFKNFFIHLPIDKKCNLMSEQNSNVVGGGGLTPAQQAAASKYAKHPQQNVAQPPAQNQQQPTQPQQQPPQGNAVNQQSVVNQQTVAPENEQDISQENINFSDLTNKTYFISSDKDKYGIIEIDLVSYKERGKEQRFLSFSVSGYDMRVIETPPQQNAFVTIDTREEFERMKKFFSELNWED